MGGVKRECANIEVFMCMAVCVTLLGQHEHTLFSVKSSNQPEKSSVSVDFMKSEQDV